MPDGREIPIKAWGWGDDSGGAEAAAGSRLRRVLERIAGGEPFPDSYEYLSRPLREEILAVYGADGDAAPTGMLTRNAYGAQVLNTASLLFLDIDVPAATTLQLLSYRLKLKRDSRYEEALSRIRAALEAHGGTFRIYRTAAGFRVLAVDRQFTPNGGEADQLMVATGTDPAYRRLCKAQDSFRARLTPKPWRCASERMPVRYPRSDREAERRFEEWLRGYETACRGFSVCRYSETVGTGHCQDELKVLVELHDRLVGAAQDLPLA